MTRMDWDDLAVLYGTKADPSLPENARLLALARHDVEIERLQHDGRL